MSGLQRVVLLAVIVGVEELLEPLDELKVVLELAFDKLLYGDDLRDGRRLTGLGVDTEDSLYTYICWGCFYR